jgi:hypothetical protein
MRLAVVFLIPALFAAEPAKLPEPFQSISDLAGAAPPEFTADALLRIVESGKLADKAARRELVEHAFQLAASAKFPVQMQAGQGTTTDTRAGSLSDAYALKLDTLSLQSRAVRDMLPLDPAMARDLFGQIVRPVLAPLTCDDALSYQPSEYYLALSAVVNGGFTPKEKAKEEHFNLLVDSLGQVTSPAQLAPLAQAIESAGITPAERQLLAARFNGLLENMQPDSRSFASSLSALFAINTPGIQPSLEKYQQKNHGCDTDAAPSSSTSSTSSTSSKQPSTPKLDPYWQSATAQQLLQAGKKLRVSSSTQQSSEADGPEWQQQLADYLNLIAGWTEDESESDAVFYHEKCIVYTALLDLVPAGPQSDKIVAEYIDFIGNSDLYQKSPAEWFLEPHTLLDRSHTVSAQHATLEAYRNSGNPVLTLEVAIQKVFGVK